MELSDELIGFECIPVRFLLKWCKVEGCCDGYSGA